MSISVNHQSDVGVHIVHYRLRALNSTCTLYSNQYNWKIEVSKAGHKNDPRILIMTLRPIKISAVFLRRNCSLNVHVHLHLLYTAGSVPDAERRAERQQPCVLRAHVCWQKPGGRGAYAAAPAQ